MGFLSSLFQTGAPVQQVAGPTIATQKLPEELAPYYKDILGKAQALYNERTKEGFQPYQGPTVADFTPEQRQAFTGISGLVGSQAPVFQEGMDLTRAAAAPMTSEQMTQYMSPYQQAVTDIEKREATKQYESQVVPQLAAKAATTGGFGGSRQAILEGMAADTQQRLLSDIQAKGSQQAYQDAVQRFQADRQAAGQAGAQLATMAPQQFKAQLGELGAIQTVGEQQQRQQQTALDEAFRQYQLERNYPYDTMSRYQSVVTGAPMGTTQFAQPAPPAPSTAQTLLGGLGTLVGTYGAFGGKLPNLFPSKKGGGIADTMVYAQNGTNRYTLSEIMKRMRNPNVIQPEYNEREYGVPFQTSANIYDRIGPLREAAESEGISVGPDGTIMKDGEVITPREAGLYRDNIGLRGSRLTNQEGFNLQRIPPARGRGDDPNIIEEGDVESFLDERGKILSNYTERKNYNKPEEIPSYSDNTDTITNTQPIIKPPVPEGIASLVNISEAPPKMEMPDQIQGPTRRDKFNIDQGRIQAEENSLMKLMQQRTEGRKKQLSESKEAQTRANWLNVAQLFSRMGSATPRQEGIMGVIGAGLEAADQTIPQIAATNAKFRDERIAIQNDIEDDKIDQAQVKLAALEKRATKERAFQREELEDFRYEQSRADKLFQENRVYDLTKQEVEGKIANDQVLDVTDIKNLQGIFDNQHYNEHYNPESGFFDGKALGAEGSLGRSIVFETFLDSINQGSSVSYALSMASSFKNRLPSIEKINQYKKDDRPEADQDFADAFFNGDLSIARRYKQLKDKK